MEDGHGGAHSMAAPAYATLNERYLANIVCKSGILGGFNSITGSE